MQLSPAGRKLLQSFEGRSLTAYPDPPLPKLADGSPNPKQKYSIGYGHSGAVKGQTITAGEAERLFDQDVSRFELAVSLAAPTAAQQQFDAMTSLAYNIGAAAFNGSTVARLHQLGDYDGASDAFRMWRLSAGAVNPVLVARREQERAAYRNGYLPDGSPRLDPAPGTAGGSTIPSPPLPPERSKGEGALLVAGVGLVFFCRSCGARSAMCGVEVAEG